MTRARLALGAAGEDMAADWYRAHGYEVIARNWRCKEGEIDLVCLRRGVLVVCEVKCRSTDAFGHPAEAVTPAKQRKLRVLAGRWLELESHGHAAHQIRFDVAAVLAGHLEVIESAF